MFVRSLLILTTMLISYSGFSQPAKSSKGQKFVPPIFGQWRTGELVVVEDDTPTIVRPAVAADSMSGPLSMLPPNVLVEFKIGFDKVACESYYEMSIIPPFPPESCQYATLTNTCVGDKSHSRPNPNQDTLRMEFGLYITKVDVVELFAAVGATAKSVVYQVRGNGHTWEGYYFIAKDGQTMWGDIPVNTYTILPNGTQRETKLPAVTLQVYHRVVPKIH